MKTFIYLFVYIIYEVVEMRRDVKFLNAPNYPEGDIGVSREFKKFEKLR